MTDWLGTVYGLGAGIVIGAVASAIINSRPVYRHISFDPCEPVVKPMPMCPVLGFHRVARLTDDRFYCLACQQHSTSKDWALDNLLRETHIGRPARIA